MKRIKQVSWFASAILASSLALSGCGGDSSSSDPEPGTQTGGTTTFSAQSYYSSNCTTCHGASAEGTGSGSALNDNEIPGMVTVLTDIKNNVTSASGFTQMKPYFPDTFKSEDITALATYIYDTFNTSGGTTGGTTTFSPQSFYSTNCATCHGADAKGISGFGNDLTGYSETELASIMKRIKSGDTSVEGYASMSTLFTNTSETDIDLLADHIDTTF